VQVRLPTIFTPVAALAFLVFTLLYTPCVAAISTISREMHSRWIAIGLVAYQTAIAWLAAFAVFQIGSLIIG
jgi:ferrous iron transport protein B